MDLYFDGAATTPLLPAVQAALTESFALFGNPSSLHAKGVASERAITAARRATVSCLGTSGGRLVFTSGGTEANNLAIFGVARRFRARGRHIVTTEIEHPSVLEACKALERDGWEVTTVRPRPDGGVTAADVLKAVRADTVLVSMMHVNNETGALLPVEDVGLALRDKPKTLFHVDGVQAFGKINACAQLAGADLYTLSGHKIGAPKGIGALYLRAGLDLDPLVYGGGQEFGLRSGTENVLGIVALGRAAQWADEHMDAQWASRETLAQQLCDGLRRVPNSTLQRSTQASGYIVSASFPGLKGEVLVHAFEAEGLYVSTGSACSTAGGHVAKSHVLSAMGRTDAEVTGTIRFSIGWWTTAEEIERAVAIVDKQVSWLTRVYRKERATR